MHGKLIYHRSPCNNHYHGWATAMEWFAAVWHVHGAPLSASFPRPLLESALPVWKASVGQTGRMSKLHEEVSCLLWSLGILHTNQHITSDGLFCVDIALQDQQVTSAASCCLQSYTVFTLIPTLFQDSLYQQSELLELSGDPIKQSRPRLTHTTVSSSKHCRLGRCVDVSLQHHWLPLYISVHRLVKHAVACLMRSLHTALCARQCPKFSPIVS